MRNRERDQGFPHLVCLFSCLFSSLFLSPFFFLFSPSFLVSTTPLVFVWFLILEVPTYLPFLLWYVALSLSLSSLFWSLSLEHFDRWAGGAQ